MNRISRILPRSFQLMALGSAFLVSATAMAQGPKAPKPIDLTKGNTMFVVPYAHLDTQWRWAYPQTIREYIYNTLHDNFELIDKYPNYVFNFSGSRRYEMMREYYPDLYERLKGYVQAGRWFPCGSSVDEADANVPSGESLIRHVLYGNRFFRKEFGVASQEFMLPDCFGFPYALPSILAHCGVKGFSTQKLTWNSANGIPFKVGNWEGPDGKSVVAALDPGSYGGQVNEDLSQNTSWLARIQNTGKISGAFVDYHYYGTGDVGGAPGESSVSWVEKSVNGKGPINVVSSRSDQMFNDLLPGQIAKLPRYKGELLLIEHSAGSVTSQAYMKRWNRKNEQLASGAETASVAAMWLGGAKYPAERLYSAWDLFLGSQMHDMLPGTSIPKAYEFCWNDDLLALNKFAAIETDAVGVITSAMDTRGQGRSVVVYNPLSFTRTDVVEATVPGANRDVAVYGPDGKVVPSQVVSIDRAGTHVLFSATVPSTGFVAYDIRPGNSSGSNLKVTANTLENEKFKVTINAAGDIASIYDKINQKEALKAPTRFEFQYENPKQFPAWNMDWEDQQKPPRAVLNTPATMRIVENGSARVAIEVSREMDGSKFVQIIRLSPGSDRVEVLNKIDWQTKETALKLAFPLTTGHADTAYDLQLGAIERGVNNPKKYEVPQHMWLDQTNGDESYGVAILNDSKYGSDKPDEDTVRMTLIYTPGVQGGYSDQATQDFGHHEILLAIQPHAGTWQKGNVPFEALKVNQPLRAYNVPSHDGRLGKSFSLFTVDSPKVSIQSIKKAEDGDEVIVRLREHSGQDVKNVKISAASAILSARELNGQEMPIGTVPVSGGSVMVDMGVYGLKTLALKLSPFGTKVKAVESKPISLAFDRDVVSPDNKRDDGVYGTSGQAMAAELFPKTLDVDGVRFNLGSTAMGAKNAMTANGQSVAIPQGYKRVYMLASAEGDVLAKYKLGSTTLSKWVNNWTGYIGQWDNRLWSLDPGPNYQLYGEMVGLTPGYVKDCEVAWYGSHTHIPSGNTFYQYSYMFKVGFDVPQGATTITLPSDPRIHVFAMTAANNTNDEVTPAAPLYDMLYENGAEGKPSVYPFSGSFTDAATVTIKAPLYSTPGGLHYTLDGSNPTASSPVYAGPFTVSDPVTVKAAEIGRDGRVGEITTSLLNVVDTTTPKIISVSSPKILGLARVEFSEKVNQASAETPTNYKFSSGTMVTSAQLSRNGRTVELALSQPLAVGTAEKLTVSGIADLAKKANVISGEVVDVTERGAVFDAGALEPKTSKRFTAPNLPVKANAPFTVNLFCKIDKMPDNLTLIGGFGRGTDGRVGTGRYFAKFADGINFWVSNKDTQSNVPLDLNKWQMLTATYDGTTMRLYKNGVKIAEEVVALADDQGIAQAMPLDAWDRKRRFEGEIRDFTIWDQDLPEAAIKRLWESSPKS